MSRDAMRCALLGTGSSLGYFGPKLPLAGEKPARKLPAEAYDKLISICGDAWRDVDYACCDDDQLDTLEANLKRAEPLIASCPACRDNFYQLFCHFSCSPHQLAFVDVTKTQQDSEGNDVVDELDFYVNGTGFASDFYDSCKSIKFGATNGFAMDLIGGGAANYSEFLGFLGDKKPEIGGSPFQINFKFDTQLSDKQLLSMDGKHCDDQNPDFRCACSDCPSICPVLDDIPHKEIGSIGGVSYVSLCLVLAYTCVFLGYFAFGYYNRYRKNHQNVGFLIDDNDEMMNSQEIMTDIDIYEDINHFSSNSSNTINNSLESFFYNLAKLITENVKRTLVIGISAAVFLSLGILKLQLETDPVNLWVPPNSNAYLQKQTFDESFGPFYRTQQIIISNDTGPVMQSYDFVKWWFEKEQEILSLSVYVDSQKITYEDVCFKPLGEDEACILESFTQYFDGDSSRLDPDNWRESIQHCTNSPVECLPPFQQPLKRSIIFGGDITKPVLESNAIIVSLLNNNNNDPQSDSIKFASSWEAKLEEYLVNELKPETEKRGLSIGFMTEISLEKELNKSTNTDARIIIISYLVMFTYASLALGNLRTTDKKIKFVSPVGVVKHFSQPLKLLIHTRFGLGLIGILIVLMSVTSAVGFCSIIGLKSTLIIAEVIPFLVLALGVDNIFLICKAVHHVETNMGFDDLPTSEIIAVALSSVGSSIFLSCSCQVICFLLGSIVTMPAVRNFALYSAVAVVFNTMLQLTVFLAILSLDLKRIQSGRLDLLFFIEAKDDDQEQQQTSNDGAVLSVSSPLAEQEMADGVIDSFFKEKYAPFLLSTNVSNCILALTIVMTGISLFFLPNIELGLDQRIALPSDSYLIDYFDDIYKYLNVGPPVYFITEGQDITQRHEQKKICSKFTECDSFSLVNILIQESERSERSTISEPPASWMDDFLLWLNPDLSDCCTIKRNSSQKQFCPPFASPRLCQSCYEGKKWGFDMSGFPVGDEFLEYLLAWLDQDSYSCPLAGKAPYGHQVLLEADKVPGGELVTGVKRSAFRTSHTPLRSQEDFINALANSERIIDEVKSKIPGLRLWAYSPFYIFFVQYGTLISLTIKLLTLGFAFVWMISTLLTNSWKNSSILLVYLIIVLVGIGSWMSLNGIGLNAVSLVNLLICLGLSVEFGIHLVRDFSLGSQLVNRRGSLTLPEAEHFGSEDIVRNNIEERDNSNLFEQENQAFEALVNVGPSTLSGITMTKFLGVGVLSFTHSQIFRVYYFRMWVGLILYASIGALVVLPVLLNRFGNKAQ